MTQTFSAGAFILFLSAMISPYLNTGDARSWLFFNAIILMIVSMVLFTLEIQIANSALDVHLSDLEKHKEWRDYRESKKRRRKLDAKKLDARIPDAKKPT